MSSDGRPSEGGRRARGAPPPRAPRAGKAPSKSSTSPARRPPTRRSAAAGASSAEAPAPPSRPLPKPKPSQRGGDEPPAGRKGKSSSTRTAKASAAGGSKARAASKGKSRAAAERKAPAASKRGSPARRKGGSPAARTSAAGPSRRRARSEVSAGGVVVRGDELVVIVPTRRAPDGSRALALPKGHIDPGETAVQAAQREVLEEAGVRGEPIGELGETRYMYRLGARLISKVVSFYLLRYAGGDPADHDHEVEEARWMSLADAEKALTHVGERKMVALARARLEENGAQDR